MPIEIIAEVFSVETYTGKNGLGANVVLLNKNEKGKLEINLKDKAIIEKMMKFEGTDVIVKAKLNQSRFGINVEILDVGA